MSADLVQCSDRDSLIIGYCCNFHRWMIDEVSMCLQAAERKGYIYQSHLWTALPSGCHICEPRELTSFILKGLASNLTWTFLNSTFILPSTYIGLFAHPLLIFSTYPYSLVGSSTKKFAKKRRFGGTNYQSRLCFQFDSGGSSKTKSPTWSEMPEYVIGIDGVQDAKDFGSVSIEIIYFHWLSSIF